MESLSKLLQDFNDPDYFKVIQANIEKELSNMKKTLNMISQLRVEAAYLESDLLLAIDSSTWQNISELIGLGSMNMMDVEVKEEKP